MNVILKGCLSDRWIFEPILSSSPAGEGRRETDDFSQTEPFKTAKSLDSLFDPCLFISSTQHIWPTQRLFAHILPIMPLLREPHMSSTV